MRYLVAGIVCYVMFSCTEKKPNYSVIQNHDTLKLSASERDSASINVIIFDEGISKKIDIQMH